MRSKQREEMKEVLAALHETAGIGWLTLERLLANGGLSGATGRKEAEWREAGLTARQACAAFESLQEPNMELRRKRWNRSGFALLTILDPDYPMRLRHIPKPPWVLYAIGRLELASKPSVAIVGTRLATAYGRRVARDLAAACSAAGLTVVSGLAKGIDACAHEGALAGTGGTVAVLGTPADRPYPPENRALYSQIAERGLLLSETPPDAVLHPGMFPLRNRVISGLALGVVVVEAAERSGSLITADIAIEQNRDLFVVPGPINSPRSRGPLLRLRDFSAKPVLDASDILEEYKTLLEEGRYSGREQAAINPEEGLSEEEKQIYQMLHEDTFSIDHLADRSGLSIGTLHAVLLSLQIKQRIHQLPGSRYASL